jgi:hypothetical protein
MENPFMYQPPDAPQSIGGVLDDGFRLFRASLPKVVVLTFFAILAGQLPNLMISGFGSVPAMSLALVGSLLLSMLISALFYAAAIGRMNAVVQQRDMPLAAALSFGLGRMLPLFAFSVLYALILIVGSLLLLVPGIIFGVSLMFGAFVVLLEGRGPLASLKISHNLVWGNWWRTLVIVSVGVIVMMTAYLLVIFVAGFAIAFGDNSDPTFLVRFLELVLLPLLGAVVAPLLYALTLATYYDLKLRRSGADLEQRLGAPAQA